MGPIAVVSPPLFGYLVASSFLWLSDWAIWTIFICVHVLTCVFWALFTAAVQERRLNAGRFARGGVPAPSQTDRSARERRGRPELRRGSPKLLRQRPTARR